MAANKAKTARRVIEVLDYFDEQHRHATVMDIVRRYNRPQSSTSELLASLVDMGILYKDASSRSYSLTPRAAILGSLSQPSLIRDGQLSTLIDQLSAQTGLGTALVGMVGLNAQLFRWKPGTKGTAGADLVGGLLDRLCDSAAGRLLLSTLPAQRRDGVLRRLNAEATEDHRFNHAAMAENIDQCTRQRFAIGPAGFGAEATMCAILLPSDEDGRPLALAVVFEESDQVNRDAIMSLLAQAAQRCAANGEGEAAVLQLVPNAA